MVSPFIGRQHPNATSFKSGKGMSTHGPKPQLAVHVNCTVHLRRKDILGSLFPLEAQLKYLTILKFLKFPASLNLNNFAPFCSKLYVVCKILKS